MAGLAVGTDTADTQHTQSEQQSRLRRVFNAGCDGLYRYILVRVGGDRNAADDLLQQTCHVAVGKWRIPRDDRECEAWLRGVAKNLIRRHWREVGKRRNDLPIADPSLAAALVEDLDSRPLPPDALAKKETVDQLLLAVTALPDADQRLVLAFYFEGRSQSDVANLLGLSVKSVESRLYRVRGRLRANLQNLERT